MVKNPPANVGDTRDVGLISGSERSPRVGSDNILQYSCLENSMDRGDWQAEEPREILSMGPQSQTCLSTLSNFQVHNTVLLLTTIMVLYIRSRELHLRTGSLLPLSIISPFSSHPTLLPLVTTPLPSV